MVRLDVDRYIGVPFLNHGRSLDGCDCWGLVRLVLFEKFDIITPSFAEVYGDSHKDRTEIADALGSERMTWTLVTPGEERPGDVVLLRIYGLPVHMGIVTEPPKMLHVDRAMPATIEFYDRTPWSTRIDGFYRHPHLQRGFVN